MNYLTSENVNLRMIDSIITDPNDLIDGNSGCCPVFESYEQLGLFVATITKLIDNSPNDYVSETAIKREFTGRWTRPAIRRFNWQRVFGARHRNLYGILPCLGFDVLRVTTKVERGYPRAIATIVRHAEQRDA